MDNRETKFLIRERERESTTQNTMRAMDNTCSFECSFCDSQCIACTNLSNEEDQVQQSIWPDCIPNEYGYHFPVLSSIISLVSGRELNLLLRKIDIAQKQSTANYSLAKFSIPDTSRMEESLLLFKHFEEPSLLFHVKFL